MSPSHVVVLGSGFAGLETAFQLRARLPEEDLRLTVITDRDEFLFKPGMIYLPFGAAEKRLHVPLAHGLRRRNIDHLIARADGIDPANGVVYTDGDDAIPYDKLVIATGARMWPEAVPGLAEFGQQVWTPGQLHRIGEDLRWVAQHARHRSPQRVLFLIPPGNQCSGPLYEIALMLDTWLRRRQATRHQVSIAFATAEPSFLRAFGPKLHDVVVEEFDARGIDGRTGVIAEKVTDREITFTDGTSDTYDELVTFAPHVAAVRYPDLPADAHGFLQCEDTTRAVLGHPEIFAPGDAGDFPVKQAFLALLQAGAVAGTIAAELGGDSSGAPFEPVSMCVLEMLDRATFARVPLTASGDVAESAVRDYRVGTSPLWRAGKAMLGQSLTAAYRAGRPFHAGPVWRAMELGLRGGARWLAS